MVNTVEILYWPVRGDPRREEALPLESSSTKFSESTISLVDDEELRLWESDPPCPDTTGLSLLRFGLLGPHSLPHQPPTDFTVVL